MDKEIPQEVNKQNKIFWHMAFYTALKYELRDYKDDLIFEDEHQLSEEALIMDVLIIKKTADKIINKNIGRLFQSHNIFEYKSETDNLNFWDYIKVVGYAMTYSSFNKIPLEDITISFVVTPKPEKLFDQLGNDRGFEIEEVSNGIYYIKDNNFKVQVIESKKLSADENVFLKHLRSSLTTTDMQEVFDAFSKYDSLKKENPYLDRVMEANQSILKEVLSMSSDAVRQIIYEHFEKDGTLDKIREDIKRETALEMLKDDFTPDKVARYVQMPLEWVQSLKK